MQNRLVLEPLVFEWTAFAPRAALRCLPAIAIAFAIGLAVRHPAAGMIAAAGAVSVGFGTFHPIGKSKTAPMLLATIGMCVSTLVGTLAGFSPYISLSWRPSGAFSVVSSSRWARHVVGRSAVGHRPPSGQRVSGQCEPRNRARVLDPRRGSAANRLHPGAAVY